MDWLEYVLPLVFLTPLGATAVVVLGLRHLFQDKPGFSASGEHLRQSGHRFRERLAEARVQLFLACALGPVVAITPLIYGMGRMLFSSHQDWIEWSLYGLTTTVLALIVGAFMMILSYRISRLRLRLACAMSVTWQLEQLMLANEQMIHVFHDVPAEGASIDHVIVTRQGVFALTVKARRAPPGSASESPRLRLDGERLCFPDHEERSPLRDARRARRWLHIDLSRYCGSDIAVRGMLMLPGWSLDIEREQPDIDVIEESMLIERLERSASTPLEAPQHTAVIQRLAALAGDRPMHVPLSADSAKPAGA
ncbi:nuclease-related domain-containing protein [Kushneria aurantia]|uniref:Nuclease-related domain-containing protein n=1 Tax=Kushneria aurantia TaxID=504092 RepID=A0ABV6G662_9GAMM|nr:nuclease-related domain-containing protein [Kushneria aurantia]